MIEQHQLQNSLEMKDAPAQMHYDHQEQTEHQDNRDESRMDVQTSIDTPKQPEEVHQNEPETSEKSNEKIPTPIIIRFCSEKDQGVTYEFDNLKLEFKLRKYSMKIRVAWQHPPEKQHELQQLFSPKHLPLQESFSVVVTKDNMSPALRKCFKNIGNLFQFLNDNIHDSSKVILSKQNIKLTVPSENEPIHLKLDLQALYEARYKWEPGSLENMEDRLLQFSNQEMEMIERTFLIQEQQELPPEDSQQELLKDWLKYGNQSDEEELLQAWTDEMVQTEETTLAIADIEEKERKIEEFQKRFPIFKKQLPSYSEQNSFNRPPLNDDKTTITSTVTGKNSVFPPGYVPPHMAKQTASDGLSSDQHLRFQANQSKKEKLKLAKQLLKMGFSTAEVIQRLEAQEQSSKKGTPFVDPNPIPNPTTNPTKTPFIQPVPQQQQPPSPQQSNERAVREMLISLIRAKTYKKLDDIQRHMANEGLHTTTAVLKRIIDEIKAKNAQRKNQNAQNPSSE